jgi:replicative DNA helicase
MIDERQKERMLLGAVINDSSLAHLLAGMTEDDFGDRQHKEIYRAIRKLMAEKRPVDPTMIAAETKGVDGLQLLNLAAAIAKEGNPWNARQYAKDLHTVGEKRRLYKLFRDCADRLIEDGDLQGVMDECRQRMRGIGASSGSVAYMPDIADRMLENLDAVRRGDIVLIPSGLPDMDRLIGGFGKGEMTVIGARPAVGKSAFGMSIALAAARAGKRVLVCSCEMSDVQYAQRVAAEITGISSMRLKKADLTDDQWVRVGEALNDMASLDIGFTFDIKCVEDLYSVCLNEQDDHGLDLLVVDYLQLLDTKSRYESETVRISRVSTKIKQLALELKIPVIALAQVSRQEGVAERMPVLKELKGSGSLEQDADRVIFLHRVVSATDAYCASHDALKRIQADGDQMIAVDVAKQRDGAIGWFATRFLPGRMRYYCLTRGGTT